MLRELVMERLTKKKVLSHVSEKRRVEVRNSLLDSLKTYLREPHDILQFSVHSSRVQEFLEVASDPLITDNYDLHQLDETTFEASQKSLELFSSTGFIS